jgi:hypothetical protein
MADGRARTRVEASLRSISGDLVGLLRKSALVRTHRQR